MTPFDKWFKDREKHLKEKFGSLIAKELRGEMYSAFEFGASVGFESGKKVKEDF